MKTMAKMMIVVCFLSIMMGGQGVQAKTVKERPKVGLVLGGGGAKGAATVGVLKYIEKAGIPIDYIAGTSIGSIVGGLYACGYRSTQLDSLFRTQEWTALLTDRNMDFSGKPVVKRNGVTYLFGFPVARKGSAMVDKSVGMIRGDRILALLDSMTNVRDSLSFDSLPIPFRCVATDYVHRRKVVMKEGNLAKSMRASMAIPGAFKAVDIDGVELLDGGLIDNLPVDVVLDMGADIVIAIDLAVNKHEDSEAWKRERSSKKYENAKSYLGQLLHWVKQRPDLTQYQENLKHIDVYINPDLKGFSAASFNEKKVAEMIRKGEEAGEKALPDLERVKEMTGEKKK